MGWGGWDWEARCCLWLICPRWLDVERYWVVEQGFRIGGWARRGVLLRDLGRKFGGLEDWEKDVQAASTSTFTSRNSEAGDRDAT